jgi:hypothetical protein
MKLTKEQIKLITNEGVYECLFTKQRFAISLFDDPSPLGNVVCFEAPVKVGALNVKDAFVICGELPNTNVFGGVCFQRLYSAQLGSLLSTINSELQCHVEDNCVFINGKQASLVIVNMIKDSAIFHIIFPKVVDVEDFQPFELGKDQQELFEQHCVNCFEQLTRSVFLETRRDNI